MRRGENIVHMNGLIYNGFNTEKCHELSLYNIWREKQALFWRIPCWIVNGIWHQTAWGSIDNEIRGECQGDRMINGIMCVVNMNEIQIGGENFELFKGVNMHEHMYENRIK